MADVSPPFTKDYRFTGPHHAMSCEVEHDREESCYVARSTGFVGQGDTAYAAALNCFRAWATGDRGWFEGTDG